MNAASIAQLKKALVKLDQGQLLDVCLRLARFKKENKELLTYLLFMADQELSFANLLCVDIDEQFALSPRLQKRTLRKIIRNMNRCLRYSSNKETETQVRIHFCRALINSETLFQNNRVMMNMYLGQIKKIKQAMSKLHGDIQADFRLENEDLEL